MNNSSNFLDFEVDELTNSIIHVQTRAAFETVVLSVLKHEIQESEWIFDWSIELRKPERSVLKLVIKDEPDLIQGLVSIQPMKGYIFMHLLESAKPNQGKNKNFIGVAGNLVAYACKISAEMGFDGFVVFDAKTALIPHYQKSLKAQFLAGNRMFIAEEEAKELIFTYFKK